MDPNTRALIMGAAGAGSTEKIYVEDVFSTWLYTGNGSTQTITNGIDLAGKGGVVWLKARSYNDSHALYDTVRGTSNALRTNSVNGNTASNEVSAFNATGFSLGVGVGNTNDSGKTYASWTFRKAAKFFDVVTYTGNGSNRTISHSLGSVPGTIIVKRTDTTGDWQVYHRSLANTEYMVLNTDAAKATGTTRWNSTTPTSTEFSLGTDATVNANTGTYVAYLFAHDAGGFGDSGNESVIKCGSFTTDGSGNATVDLGWEPQWLLAKRNEAGEPWVIADNMRGWTAGSSGSFPRLEPNTSSAEANTSSWFGPTSTGFVTGGNAGANKTYIYIAIRRGPMKTPTDATKVFSANAYTGNSTSNSTVQSISVGFAGDAAWITDRNHGGQQRQAFDKLRGSGVVVYPSLAFAEINFNSSYSPASVSFTNTSLVLTGQYTNNGLFNQSPSTYIAYSFRRAPGFFDVAAYTGNGSSSQTVTHQLKVKPQLLIVKRRDSSGGWYVWPDFSPVSYMQLNSSSAAAEDQFSAVWANTAPTASVFTVGNQAYVNGSGATFIAYLFATCPGVSKVGSYTGTGTTLSIDCGFTNGSRLVLIKRTDSTGNWYIWDSARGIVSGNDPYLLLNSTAAEVTNTDYIDPLSSGFQISSTAPAEINANGGSYIFLAVA